MATPYDLYVRFLITKNVDSVDDVNRELQDFRLPHINTRQFDKQYDFIASHVPAGIMAQIESGHYGVDFMRWMRMLEVADFWPYEPAFRDPDRAPILRVVYGIHADPILRMTMNALLIKNVPIPDIAQPLNMRFAAMVRDEHVDLYRRFFFNPARMTRAAWNRFLRLCSDKERAVYFLALTRPLEEVKTELELPSSVDVSGTLQFLLNKSFNKAKELLDNTSKSANFEAREWIKTCLALTDKYEKYRSADTTDFGKNLQMEFEFVSDELPVPDPATLASLAKQAKDREAKKDSDGSEVSPESPAPEGVTS